MPRPLLVLIIFGYFFLASLIPQLFIQGFSTPEDPYYHARHAVSYWDKEPFEYPQFSTINDSGTDLWYLYHVSMAPFTAIPSDDGYSGIILGSKIYHAVLSALLFTILVLCLVNIQTPARSKVQKTTLWSVLLSLGIIMTASATFADRALILSRPHLISITLFVLATYFLIKKRHISLAFVSLLAPLFYSFSLLIIIPALVYPVAYLFYVGIRNREAVLGLMRACILSGVSIIGCILGIILHPGSGAYIFNGLFVHATSLFRTVVPQGRLVEYPAELGGAPFQWGEWWALIGALVLAVTVLRIISYKSIRRSFEFVTWFVICLSLPFVFLSIFVGRGIEYALPLLLFPLSIAISWCIPRHRSLLSYLSGNPAITFFEKHPRVIRGVGIAVAICILPILIIGKGSALKENEQTQGVFAYKNAANFIASQGDGGIVLNPAFHLYPQLVFFNPRGKYGLGFDPTFTYIYDEEIYWLLQDIGYYKEVDPEAARKLLYSKGVRYVIEEKVEVNDTPRGTVAATLRLGEPIYTDPDTGEVMIWKIAP
ncbi:MAG TPA: hypothetical protein PLF31_00880 [Candidatus Paceibacterota bacterium]|nr:hypothetical protein [Candidatus Paceibacterota bacterium]